MSQAGVLNRGVFPPGSVVQTLEGNTGGKVGPDGTNNINVVGDGTTVEVAGNPGTHTLTISTADAVAIQYTTDAGVAVPVAGNLNVFGGTAGRDINTSGSGDTIQIDLNNAIVLGDLTPIPQATDAITLTTGDLSLYTGNINFFSNSNPAGGSITLGGGPFMTNFGGNGVTLGTNAGGSSTFAATTNGCVAIGDDTLFSVTNTQFCTAVGYISQELLTSGVNNTSLGAASFNNLLTGSNSIAVGFNAASAYTGAESDNIIVGNLGVTGDNGVTRIGTNGSQTSCFVAGIDGVDVGSVATVVTEAGDQLGTAVITAGTNITITPGPGTITIDATGGSSPVAFFATRNATLTGVTGAGTDYVIPFDDVVFNDGGGFSVDTFTAPVDGRYLFTFSFYMQNCLNTNISGFAQLRTSVGAFQCDEFNPYLEGFTANGYYLRNFTNIVGLTAGQTAKCAVRVFFNATDNINLVGIADTGGFATSFSGFLLGPISGGSGGGVTGPGSSTTRDIATWNGATGDALYDNPGVTISSAGYLQNTNQPAFGAYLNTSLVNVTGASTVYAPIIFDSTFFNQSGSYNTGTGIFTIPVTGIYHIQSTITLSGVGAAHISANFLIQGLALDATFEIANPFAVTAFGGLTSLSGSITAHFTAGTSVFMNVTVYGGAQTVGILGADAGQYFSQFSGYLVC